MNVRSLAEKLVATLIFGIFWSTRKKPHISVTVVSIWARRLQRDPLFQACFSRSGIVPPSETATRVLQKNGGMSAMPTTMPRHGLPFHMKAASAMDQTAENKAVDKTNLDLLQPDTGGFVRLTMPRESSRMLTATA